MWNTSEGIRKLGNSETALVFQGVGSLLNALEVDPSYEVGNPFFDKIPEDQKETVLLDIADQLSNFEKDNKLHAWNEATVWAIFQSVLHDLEVEMEMLDEGEDPDTLVRDLIEASWKEIPEEETEGGKFDPEKFEDWEEKIEVLSDRILHDRDFEMGDLFLDIDPTRVKELKNQMGIEEEYFMALPPLYTQEKKYQLMEGVNLMIVR